MFFFNRGSTPLILFLLLLFVFVVVRVCCDCGDGVVGCVVGSRCCYDCDGVGRRLQDDVC